MPRPPRVQYENAFYHVMNRGRGRRWIFHGEACYEAFLGTLEEAHDRHDARIHAYCLFQPEVRTEITGRWATSRATQIMPAVTANYPPHCV